MPRINKSDLFYALRHPIYAFRYLVNRDNISYETCATYLPADPIIVEAGAYDGSNTRDFGDEVDAATKTARLIVGDPNRRTAHAALRGSTKHFGASV